MPSHFHAKISPKVHHNRQVWNINSSNWGGNHCEPLLGGISLAKCLVLLRSPWIGSVLLPCQCVMKNVISSVWGKPYRQCDNVTMDFHWSLLRDWGNLSSWKLLRAGPTLGLGPTPLPMVSSAQVLRFSKSQESNAVSGTFTWLNHGFPPLVPMAITWPILDGESLYHLKKRVVRRRLTQMIKWSTVWV